MNARTTLILDKIELRTPLSSDGDALKGLLATTPALDDNAVQCTLVQYSHFAKTSVAALMQGRLVGFVSAYYPPDEPNTLYVWQVVVMQKLRDLGLGKKMLHWLIAQPACEKAVRLITAIGIKNSTSWSMFDSFARDIGALPIKSFVTPLLARLEREPDEYLLRISPLPTHAGQFNKESSKEFKTASS